jgi:hypothetical protein
LRIHCPAGDLQDKSAERGQIGDVSAPDLFGPINPQPTQQVGVGPKQKSPAMRQHDMRHPQFGALATQNRKILAPVKLKGIARVKMQRRKGPAPCRLLLALVIGAPPSRKCRHPAI